jgi:NAD+ synthase (glutamine-hydrolysing)
MIISIAQIDSIIGDFEINADKILAFARQAWEDQAEMVLFPELAIPGCPSLDLVDQDRFVALNNGVVNYLKESLPEDIAVGVGYIKRSGPDRGERLLNAYGIIRDGELVFEQTKPLFSDERHFKNPPRQEWNVYEFEGKRIGFIISEDALKNADGPDISLLCVPSATPFVAGNFKNRLALAGNIVREKNIPVLCVNMVGANGETIFEGRSFLIDPKPPHAPHEDELSPPVFCAELFKEDLALCGVSRYVESPGLVPLKKIEDEDPDPFKVGLTRRELDELEDALVSGIKGYMKKSGFSRAHLGLSGGIDSSLVAYLAVKAAGAKNVVCFSLPSRFSSQGSKDDAKEQAKNLGCRFETIPIEECYKAFLSTLEGIFENRPFDVTEENLQPRIRGDILMAYSNKFNSMLLSPGNKSEIAMGYCTLYGDMCGALGPIGDLFKTEVFALCRRINERSIGIKGKVAIPLAIIDKPPSAELRPDQKDEDSLPPYTTLDEILKLYLHDNLSIDNIVEKGWDEELVNRVIKTVARSEFKRRQAAPLLGVSPRSFGIGRKIPIVRVISELI